MSWSQTSPGRRRTAVSVLGVATIGPLLDGLAGGHVVDTAWFTFAIVLAGFLVGSWLRPWSALVAALVGAAALTAANQVGDPGSYSLINDYFFFAVLLGGAVLAGALIAGRRSQLSQVRELSRVRDRQHADELAAAQLRERSRLQTTVASAVVGRLEDVIALTQDARYAGDRTAVAAIEAAGRELLGELRGVVGVLRAEPTDSLPPADRRRPPSRPPLTWIDALAGSAGIPVAIESVVGAHSRGPAMGNVAVALLLGLPLLYRRRNPLTALAVVLALATLMSAVLTPLPTTVTILAPLSISAYAVGAHLRGPRRWLGIAMLGAGLAATVVVSPPSGRDPGGMLPTVTWVLLAVLFGAVSEQYSRRAAEVADLLSEVERGRDHELTLVVAEQRAFLAGELHDNLAHAMTVVCLHAEAAQLPGADLSTVRTSLDVVAGATEQALIELRSGLAGLDSAAEATSLDQEIRQIAYGLDLDPVMDIAPDPGIGREESALLLRVVREALVNVSRYAPGAPVEVRLAASATAVSASVRNGPPPRPPMEVVGTGSGLRGLDTRARSAGGRLRWGEEAGGGFEVVLELPRSGVPMAALR